MKKIELGRTGLQVSKTAMGCLPVQRCTVEDAVKILRAAYEGGINYFDTANSYTDSEKKIGLALAEVRDNIVISTKSQARDAKTLTEHIENSLRQMKTEHIDLFQFHQMPALPDPEEKDGIYAAALRAKERGLIGHIGITTHSIDVAEKSIESGLFETLQFPFSYISSERDLALAGKCRAAGMGFIAMKGLAGGLLTDAAICYAFMAQYDNVVPIWGIQRPEELEQWLSLARAEPVFDDAVKAKIAADRDELGASFCRSCGYCMPCPMGIEIRNCARMNMLLRRSPWKQYYSAEWRAKMERINDCIGCRQCSSKCPYSLDTPNLLKYMLKDYNEFYEEHKNEL